MRADFVDPVRGGLLGRVSWKITIDGTGCEASTSDKEGGGCVGGRQRQ